MKTEITPFEYNCQTVRTIADESGNPWFVLADVCAVLELTTPAKVADRLDDDEKGVSQIHTLGGIQNMTIISESGLYAVILRSDKPQAKPFRKWVTGEVLPSIRKTGSYQTGNELPSLEQGKQKLVQLKQAAAAVRAIASMDKALSAMSATGKAKALAAAGECGVDLSELVEQSQLTQQEAREADVIKYLMKHKEMTARYFQQTKSKAKPWALIRPKSAIGQVMRATIAELEQRGVISRTGGNITLNTIH